MPSSVIFWNSTKPAKKPFSNSNSTTTTTTTAPKPSSNQFTLTTRAAPVLRRKPVSSTNNNETATTSNNSTTATNTTNTTKPARPSQSPTRTPTTSKPSRAKTAKPTAAPVPPTQTPTISLKPTPFPTNVPTSSAPTSRPTQLPSYQPTVFPSLAPSLHNAEPSSQKFQQIFLGGSNLTEFTEDQKVMFQQTLESYTFNYTGKGPTIITTIAEFDEQFVTTTSSSSRSLQQQQGNSMTPTTTTWSNQLNVHYTMEWQSNRTNVTDTAALFFSWMSNTTNQATFVSDLRLGGLIDVENSTSFSLIISAPTAVPTPVAVTYPPTPTKKLSSLTTIVIAVFGGVGFSCVLAILIWFFCVHRPNQHKKDTASNNASVEHTPPAPVILPNGPYRSEEYNSTTIRDVVPIAHRQESLNTHPSLISADDEEYDSTTDSDVYDESPTIIDEFDSYKNQHLEKMRREVEGNVDNMDGMMSQALTKVLMEDNEYDDETGLLWGGSGDHAEIEASVLCETHDWLKRKEDATLEERNAFMQGLLNRMVATVRYNYIPPEKGSRAIHGAAAMLGLQLAGDLPETAILVSGMRHKAEKKDLIEAFKVFGEIEDAAVAPNFRGFGLVRFLSPKAVQRATERYRTDRIDVQDVSVNVRVLSAPTVIPPPAEVTRQLSSGQNISSNASAAAAAARKGIDTRRDRGRGVMESNLLPQQLELNTIGYPSDSLGRSTNETKQRVLRMGNSSDGGSSDGRSKANSRDPTY